MDKQLLRERVWQELEIRDLVTFPKPAQGRIPNFVGSDAAVARIRNLPAYESAKIIMVNPDAAQLVVREIALRDGKQLLMASPRLRSGFIMLDPKIIKNTREAATIKGSFKNGHKVDIRDVKVDLIVEGSVAVDLRGGRIGKGGGFGDIEVAILNEVGAASDTTPIVTTVHELQIVESVPMTEHDISVDFIVTPDRTIKVEHGYRKPSGILWELLPSDAFNKMPILGELRRNYDSRRG
jgi:5-formyltetrahydrofolate cyclo-ligase